MEISHTLRLRESLISISVCCCNDRVGERHVFLETGDVLIAFNWDMAL